jgi:hypothetical protein
MSLGSRTLDHVCEQTENNVWLCVSHEKITLDTHSKMGLLSQFMVTEPWGTGKGMHV